MQPLPDELSFFEQLLKSLPRATPSATLRERILAEAKKDFEMERQRQQTRRMIFGSACIFLVCFLLTWTQGIRLRAAGSPPGLVDLADRQGRGRHVHLFRGNLHLGEALHGDLGIPLDLP